MKISMKLADIETTIEDETCQDRIVLEGEVLGCIEALIKSRINLECEIAARGERAEDEPGQKPDHTEHQVKPAITMAGLYV